MPTITVVPGDGIGPEVTREAVAVLDALGLGLTIDLLDQVNADRFLAAGTALTDDDVTRIRDSAATLLGAVGDPRVGAPEYARGVLLRLRTELDLYVNLRPVRLLHDRLSPLRDGRPRALDCVIVRENTEGLYSGIGGTLRSGTRDEVAVDADVSTWLGVSRVVDHAFGIARRGVCMVDKSNAVPAGGRLWQRCWRDALARHPQVPARHLYVDVAAMNLVAQPETFDVIVTNNSYGDILSDLAATLAGGLGAAASGNINPVTGAGLYEPVHGSAPDLAGRGIANPVGAVLSAALLVEHLGHHDAAEAVRAAVRRTVHDGRCTPDLGGALTTTEAGAAIRAALG